LLFQQFNNSQSNAATTNSNIAATISANYSKLLSNPGFQFSQKRVTDFSTSDSEINEVTSGKGQKVYGKSLFHFSRVWALSVRIFSKSCRDFVRTLTV